MTDQQTPVDEIREAARLMRERAQAATPGPWRYIEMNRLASDAPNVEYITSMHPVVALAVADVFDKVAWAVELDPDLLGRVGYPEVLTAARAYLGGAS